MSSIMSNILLWLGLVLLVRIILVQLVFWILGRFVFARRERGDRVSVAFFHPYCNAGGGGERVLWSAIQKLADISRTTKIKVVIFAINDGSEPSQILSKARKCFDVSIPDTMELEFKFINSIRFLEAKTYPRFTLIGQALGSILVAFECLRLFVPDIWLDSMGAPFTFIAARLAGSSTACYMHYPMISRDMLERVRNNRPDYNNDAMIASSSTLSSGKLLYYKLFALLFGLTGKLCDVVMVNGSWTKNNLDALWNLKREKVPTSPAQRATHFLRSATTRLLINGRLSLGDAERVFPSCNTEELASLPLGNRDRIVCSVGQFRPEKDHALQLRSFRRFLYGDYSEYESVRGVTPAAAQSPRRQRSGSASPVIEKGSAVGSQKISPLVSDVKLILIGGARNAEDQERVRALQQLASELGIADNVEFMVNAPFEILQSTLGRAAASIHTMWNEHFGIGVVESLAAGAFTIAHGTGGPLLDILVPYEGFPIGRLATDEAGFSRALVHVFLGDEPEPIPDVVHGFGNLEKSAEDALREVDFFKNGPKRTDLVRATFFGRLKASVFSEQGFQSGFWHALAPLVAAEGRKRGWTADTHIKME